MNDNLHPTIPHITYPEELPVSAYHDVIAQAIQNNPVVIICGETGSGKTTQIPKICLELGRGQKARIGHTQPRRIAASSTAQRIAKELNTPLGHIVGYKIRFTDKIDDTTSIKVMTDGVLLAETQTDRLLKQYDTIIIDEAHERSLNIDFLLGYLKQLLPKRPDLKIIITSATIDAARFATHFKSKNGPAPIIEVSGRSYPVEIRYRPLLDTQDNSEDKINMRDYPAAIGDAIDELWCTGSGDVLIFLPGEREIRETADALRAKYPPTIQILPLFARLSQAEQEKIFKRTNARRLILATNVAETSLTVPGIRFVVDAGLARIKRYSYKNKVEQLHIESISKASANQRAGRCGRIGPGICIRLYDETEFDAKEDYTPPEIMRSSLAHVILSMKSLRLGPVESFPFMQPPLKRAIADGYQLLHELGALDAYNNMTALGRELSQLPIDPRIGRMILAARNMHCLKEILIIASALSIQDPRERPIDAMQAADKAHQKFHVPKSEFLSFIKLWQWFEEALKNKESNRKLQQQCRDQFLSFLRLKEWRDVHEQLTTIVTNNHWRINSTDATFEQIHLALLTGLLGNIGYKTEDTSIFLGARGIRFSIWPGSFLAKKNGRWIMAAELVDTSRLFARCVATIEPEWLEKIGSHLLKKSYSNPHWEKKPAQVIAYERATLYGLVVYNQRKTHYGRINPEEARTIFIRDALVGGDFETSAPFFKHNQRLVEDIEKLEHKSRRFDILIDDTLIASFYEKLIPTDIINGYGFEKWYKQASQTNKKLLFLNRDDLMRHEASGITTDLFPKKMTLAGIDMSLDYHFEPGSENDGVTLTVPIATLNQINKQVGEWLVPGMLKEKTQFLLKSLPQRLRRHCIPLPQYAQAFSDRIQESQTFAKGSLTQAIIDDIQTQCHVLVRQEDFRLETLPSHLFLNYRVIDEHGRRLNMSRDLATLQNELGQLARQSFQELAEQKLKSSSKNDVSPIQSQQIVQWDFEPLPELMEIQRGQKSLIGYPALVDHTTHCTIEVFDDPQVAAEHHRKGLTRLFALQVKDQIKFLNKNIHGLTEMSMHFIKLGTQEELSQQIIFLALQETFLISPLPTTKETFLTRVTAGKAKLVLLCQEIARLIGEILERYSMVLKRIASLKNNTVVLNDITKQLQQLIDAQFIQNNTLERLKHFPRYLNAILARIDKCSRDPQRDQKQLATYHLVATLYYKEIKNCHQQHIPISPKVKQFRWLLEELRVSLFAQELRTPFPVSVKRLFKIWSSNN